MGFESGLPRLEGYPFEVRCSNGALRRATAAADVAAAAYGYFKLLFSGAEPDVALIVADEADWPEPKFPYGLPCFTDELAEIRRDVV